MNYNLSFIDFFNILENNSIDLILTDPPYEMEYHDGISKNPLDKIKNDKIGSIDWNKLFLNASRVLKERKMIYVHCRIQMVPILMAAASLAKLKFIHDFIWLKGDMGYGNLNIFGISHELILGWCKGNPEKSRILIVNNEFKKRTPAIYYGKLSSKENYGHPTQKPIGLLSYIILNRTDINDVIIDPFSGSGSTEIASSLLERNFIGSDIDNKFVLLAEKRIQDIKHMEQYKSIPEQKFIWPSGNFIRIQNSN